ncbi:MAG: DNA/RNA nuclease SfsA [Candidatus Sigynarchaeota archaeon]
MIIATRVIPASFIDRPNKYLVRAQLDGGQEIEAHLADPGRLKELLFPGVRGWVVQARGPKRKTSYDFIAVDHGGNIVSVDTRVPNKYVKDLLDRKYLFPFAFDTILPEFRFGENSRIDFMATRRTMKYLIEVKSVTLVEDGVALFPDAPTARGTKHLHELVESRKKGYIPVIVLVIQRGDANSFKPHARMDPAFAKAFERAREHGVDIKAFTSNTRFDDDGALRIEPLRFVPVDT